MSFFIQFGRGFADVKIKKKKKKKKKKIFITETSPCAIGNFHKWLLYMCFMSLSLIAIQTNIKFLKITVT